MSGQQAQRVLEPGVPFGAGWEVDAEGGVLLREPAQPEATDRPAVRQHVERGDRVGEHGRMTEERRRDEHAEPDPLGDTGQPGERGVRLGQVLPRRTDLRDLAQVVHHPDVLDAGRLGLGDDPLEVLGEVRAVRPATRSSRAGGRSASDRSRRRGPGRMSPARTAPSPARSPAAYVRRSRRRQCGGDERDRIRREDVVPGLGRDGGL